MNKAKRKSAYHIRTVNEGTPQAKTFWRKIGSAFVNLDGSINVVLSALPIDGKIQIRDVAKKGTCHENLHQIRASHH